MVPVVVGSLRFLGVPQVEHEVQEQRGGGAGQRRPRGAPGRPGHPPPTGSHSAHQEPQPGQTPTQRRGAPQSGRHHRGERGGGGEGGGDEEEEEEEERCGFQG